MESLGHTKNYFHDFAVDFWQDKLVIQGKAYFLGEISTETLNYDDGQISTLASDADRLEWQARKMYAMKNVSLEIIQSITGILGEMNQKLLRLPIYEKLNIDMSKHNDLPSFLSNPEIYRQISNRDSDEFRNVNNHLVSYISIPRDLHKFRGHVIRMESEALRNLQKRNANIYACAAKDFFGQEKYWNNESFLVREDLDTIFDPYSPAYVSYAVCAHPEDSDKLILVDRFFYNELFSFLAADFFKGLQHGHAPKKCKNCGQYFLNRYGYNVKYCDGKDPNRPERTCRQIGAKNSDKEKAAEFPALKACNAARNKFWAERKRGHISETDYASILAELDTLRVKIVRDGLSEEQAKTLLESKAVYARLNIDRIP